MKAAKRIFQEKRGRKWITTYESDDQTLVYRGLSEDLIAKHISKARFVKSIRRTNNYDGTITITATYDNETRNLFVVPW